MQGAQEKLKSTLAYYEKEITRYKYEAAQQRYELQQLLDGLASQEYNKLNTLVSKYTTAFDKLNRAQDYLTSLKTSLAKYEAGLMNKYDLIYQNIQNCQNNITNAKSDIASAEAQLAIYKTDNIEEAIEKLSDLQEQNAIFKAALAEADNKWTIANVAKAQAEVAIKNSDYMKSIEAITDLGGQNILGVYFVMPPYYTNNSLPADAKGNWNIVYTSQSEGGNVDMTNVISLFADGALKYYSDSFEYTGYEWDSSDREWKGPQSVTIYGGYNYYPESCFAPIGNGCKEFATLLEKTLNENYQVPATESAQNLKKAVEKQTKLIGAWAQYKTDANNNYGLKENDPKAPALQAKYQASLKELKAALKAVGARFEFSTLEEPPYGKDETTGEWWYRAEQYYDQAISYIDSEVASLTTIKNNDENALAEKTVIVDGLTANLETISTGYADFAKLVKEYNTASKAAGEAYAEYEVCNNNVRLNNDLIEAYTNVKFGQNDWEQMTAEQLAQKIEALEETITDNQKIIEENNEKIAQCQAQLEDPSSIDNDKEIANLKAEIEKVEAEVASLQSVVDAAKAALDAALAAE